MSINQQTINQTIALAGLAQSIRIVQGVAWKGQSNLADFKSVVTSLLKIDAESAIAVYGGSFEVISGLRLLKQQLDTENSNKDPQFVGMAINIITLQKQLIANTTVMNKLTTEMTKISGNYLHQDYYEDDEVFNNLIKDYSRAYKNTLSQLSNRIQIKGDPNYLKPEENQIKVRAALLCAIRSVFLWRQSGGSRWQFIFKKKNIIASADYLLKNPQKI